MTELQLVGEQYARAVELAGKLAVYWQEDVVSATTLFYDECIDLDVALGYVRDSLIKAKRYRDIFFLDLKGEQLPSLTFPFDEDGELQVAAAEEELKALVGPRR